VVGSELTGAALEGFGLVLAAVDFAFAFGLPRFSDDLDRLTCKRPRFVLGLGGAGSSTPSNSFSFSTFLACLGGVPKDCALLLLNFALDSEAVVESSSLLGVSFLRDLFLGLSPSSAVSVKTPSSVFSSSTPS
jgi:hypothetical protein